MEPETPYHKVETSVTRQSILAFIFALVVSSDLGWLSNFHPVITVIVKFLPAIICLIGVGFNIYLVFFSKEVDVLKDFVFRTAPIILVVGWIALLVFFSLQAY